MKLTLKTIVKRDDGCFSVLCAHDQQGLRPFAVTCERTFENLRTVIGLGTYKCKRTTYIKGGYPTFEIMIAGHSRVLFHRGNKEGDSEACVLVAESFTTLDNATAIGDSKGGFSEFWWLVKDLQEFDLEVTDR